MESFLAEARPWAMRQARRAYRHLPVELQEQGFDQAAAALRTGAPSTQDRRALYADLARHLDDELRAIHAGWCLNRSQVPADAPPSENGPSVRQPIASFVEDGLGGLERAVLQLELGAGRDTSTARAALRLGPRRYARHRELGLGKLRGAIAGGLRGRVCDQHLDAVTLAATGDRDAAERLSSGPERCRACAREASGLRRLLQHRLALAPWPLAIKPAGALAAKLGALGGVLGGKSAAGGGLAGTSLSGTASGAKVVAGVVAAAAAASGGIAAFEPAAPERRTAAPATADRDAPAAAAPAAGTTTAAQAATDRARTRKTAPSPRRKAASERAKARRKAAAETAAPSAAAQPQQPQAAAAEVPPATRPEPADAVRRTVDGVKKTVDGLTGRLAPAVPEVDDLVPGVDRAVDDLTGTVDDLLTP